MTEKPEVLNNQAILLAADGKYFEAIACIKRALIIEKENYLLWYNLGVTYRDAGQLKEAKKALLMACKINPENIEVLETTATVCLMQKELLEVQEICFMGLDINPLASHLWNLLGVVSFQQEDYESASENFEQAVSINPYYLDAIYNLRDAYSVLKNNKGVQECENKLKNIR